jgi:putative transposase
VKRIERVKLYPTPRQAQAWQFMLDVTRELYNAALQERRDAYRLRRVNISACGAEGADRRPQTTVKPAA